MTAKRKQPKPVTGDGGQKPRDPADKRDVPTRARRKKDGKPTRFKFDDPRKAKFIELLEKTGGVTTAARGCGMGRQTVYAHRANDEAFAAAWDEALEAWVDKLQEAAVSRAVDGWMEPMVSAGQLVTHVRRYDSSLMQLLLKAKRPNEFRERQTIDMNATVRGAVMVVPPRAQSEEAWTQSAAQTTTLPAGKESK